MSSFPDLRRIYIRLIIEQPRVERFVVLDWLSGGADNCIDVLQEIWEL